MRLLQVVLIAAATTAQGYELQITQTAEVTSDYLTEKDPVTLVDTPYDGLETINIDLGQTYQTIEGFGGAFTDSTAWLYSNLNDQQKEEFIEAYFGPTGHKYSMGRLTIGSSDFSLDHYNYCNTTDDYELKDFSILHDEAYIIPMILDAQAKVSSYENSEELKLLSTPWSPPAWMKRNKRMSNSLKPGLRQEEAVFESWALYFSKYITSYQAAGVNIRYVTVQNEPHVATQFLVTYECCGFDSVQERDFLRDYLGPTLERDHPEVQIYIHDDQKDDKMIDMVTTIMQDPEAAKYVDGVGFHWYGNWGKNYDILDEIHEAYPDLPLLGTEATLMRPLTQNIKFNGGEWHQGQMYAVDIIRDLNHHARGWIDWNMLLDLQGGPSNQNLGPLKDLGNCDAPIRTNLTGYPWIDREDENGDGKLIYRPAYWHFGHFSRFLPRGSRRVKATSSLEDESVLEFTSFVTPEDELVVIVLNANDFESIFSLDVPKYGYGNWTIPEQGIVSIKLSLNTLKGE